MVDEGGQILTYAYRITILVYVSHYFKETI